MSGPSAGGSQAMPGQWPEPNSKQSSYDSTMARSIDQRSMQGQQRSHMSPPARQLTDPLHPPYAQPRDGSAPRGFQSPTSTSLDSRMGTGNTLQVDDHQNAVARKPSGSRTCAKCGKSLSGQFVRALDATYHLECFTCHECGKIVASKFFPVPDEGPDQYPLCENDYFKRLDLICFACGNALRGSYITALDRKYHIEHFTCSVCPTIFGAQDSYYEHDGDVYCHYHYSTRFAQRCHGCHNSILKQFVEIFRNGQNQHWHPECYMIHKYWNVRLYNPDKSDLAPQLPQESLPDAPEATRRAVRTEEELVEAKVHFIWRSLSTFEERAATCISDMLLHVSNGAFYDGIMAARKFIIHIELFFDCTDELDKRLTVETSKGLSYGRESKLLCKKVVSFFQLLSESQTSSRQRLGVTQELLSLVTGLAHYLKLLIRICLQGALRLERETGSSDGLETFLKRINTLDEKLAMDEQQDSFAQSAAFVNRAADSCPVCEKPVEDRCARKGDRVFHYSCLVCKQCGTDLKDNLADAKWSQKSHEILCRRDTAHVSDAEGGFVPITRLKQYVHLLKVAHARLLATLRSTGAIKDRQELSGFDASRGNVPSSTLASFGANDGTTRRESTSYEQTLGDIRRLRSTRLEQPLNNTMKRARSSRIIDGPGGSSVQPGHGGSSENGTGSQNMHIVHDRDPTHDSQNVMLGVNQMALDDIPRLLQAEVTREMRPNAAKYAGNNLTSSQPKARLINGQYRNMSGDMDKLMDDERFRPRKFLSELSALEYFIVRHIAVLYMEPLLDESFTQQELIDLIETKRPSIWDRFNKAFKADKKQVNKKAVFGRSLEQVVERDGAESVDGVGPGALRVPAVLDQCVAAMRHMDMSVEGVFRKNGNIRRLRELQEEIDAKGSDMVDLTKENAVQVAALLKKFLRDMPDPVLTFKLHRLFITAAKIPDDEKRRRVLHLASCLLPKVHRDTMEVLFTFLNWVSSFHTVDEESGSKMDIHNLATVIAPNILYSNSKNPEVESTFLAVEAIHCLIESNDSLCEVPEDILSVLNDPNLFEGSAELTTKEILKRYGDVGKTAQPQSPAMSSPGGRPLNGSRPSQGRHVGNVVSQDPRAWQNESSVRHVGGAASTNNFTYGPSQHGVSTPPGQYTPGHHTPGAHTPGAVNSPGRQDQFRSDFRNQGPMGIGAG